jgi:hypothetical protein
MSITYFSPFKEAKRDEQILLLVVGAILGQVD